jgi:hypothetical protein
MARAARVGGLVGCKIQPSSQAHNVTSSAYWHEAVVAQAKSYVYITLVER